LHAFRELYLRSSSKKKLKSAKMYLRKVLERKKNFINHPNYLNEKLEI